MADQLSIKGRPHNTEENGKVNENGEPAKGNVYATKSAEVLVLPEALEQLLAVKDHKLTEVKSTGWTKPEDKDRSIDLDIYDDLDEVKHNEGTKHEEMDKSLDLDIYDNMDDVVIKKGTKHEEMDKSLDLDIYDDLDDFQKAEDRKTKELMALEVKYEKAIIEIGALKVENKALEKKIKTMEVNLQNLLDTAKSEVKRKETLIAQLRNEKDDICFRRKRGREVQESGQKGPESKRLKESQSRMVATKDPEMERNPFRTATKENTKNLDMKKASIKDDIKKASTKDDVKKASTREDPKKSDRRSKSPKQLQPKANERKSSAHTRRPENRQRSRDRRHSRSRSPKHNTRRESHQSRESSARHIRRRSRSQSPRIQLAGESPIPTKDDVKKANTREDPKKSDRRSKSPKQLQPKANERKSSAHTRRPENRQRSRDRRHSRSRSPKHNTRRESHQSRESSARHIRRRSRSQSPRIQLAGEKSHTVTTLCGDKTNDLSSKSPHIELAKMETELQPSRKVLSKQIDHTSDLNIKSSTAIKEQPKEVSGGFFSEISKSKQEFIPGLNKISQPEPMELVHKEIELTKKVTKPVEKINIIVENHATGSAHSKLKETTILGLNLDVPRNDRSSKIIPATLSKPETELQDVLEGQKQLEEPQVKLEKETNISNEPSDVQADINEDRLDNVVLTKSAEAYTEKCSQLNENTKESSEEDIRTLTENCTEQNRVTIPNAGIQIIEDILLPKISFPIVKVDKQCEPTAITNSACNEDNFEVVDHNIRLGETKEPTPSSSTDDTPIKSATVLYAKPDSTKVDHNDENDEVILEAAMNLLTSEQDSPSVADPTYPNLSIEEDAIEMALEQLHQHSPDDSVVTSTSNRALQTPKQNLITMLTQSPIQGSPLKSKEASKEKSPMATPEKSCIEKTPLKKRKVNMDSSTEAPPVNLSAASENVSMNNTSGTSLFDEPSIVTKRCTLGNTDYQYELINGETILRVKRRCRRRRPAPAEFQTDSAGDKTI
uniref:Protein SON n=1 Tax=Drosophila rhopaloa TaxID=1041015 RepID=A0A6P4FHT9_DRORH